MPASKRDDKPTGCPTDRLDRATFDAATGLHVGTVQIGVQRLRVGIRPGAGRPLVLCNGIGANLELAVPLMQRLEGRASMVFDVPGAGQSPPPSAPYRLFMLASLLGKLLDHLGYDQVDLLGVSWGGALAQQFAIQYPRRVRRLVLAATSMGGPMLPGHPSVLAKMVNPRRYIDKGYMKRVAPELYGGRLREDPDAIRLFTDHARAGDRVGYRYQLLALMGWTSLPWLWRIRQPTLVLAGEDDPLVPLVNARLHARLLPNAELKVLHDGHLFMLTQADETARLVERFLGATDK